MIACLVSFYAHNLFMRVKASGSCNAGLSGLIRLVDITLNALLF